MTPAKAKSKRNEKIKSLALRGYSRQAIARLVKLHPNTVATVLSAYVTRGELMEVPNSSPRVYISPRTGANEGIGGKTGDIGLYAENYAPPPSSSADSRITPFRPCRLDGSICT